MNFRRSVRLDLAWPLLSSLLMAMPATAQTSYQSSVVSYASHSDVGVLDPFVDDAFEQRQGSLPLGRIEASADSDHISTQFNGFGRGWSEVDLAGVHVYAVAQATAGPTGPSGATGSSLASGFFSDYFGLSAPGLATGTVLTITAIVNSSGSTYATTNPSWTGFAQANRADAVTFWESWVRVIPGGAGPNLAELRARQDCVSHTNAGQAPFCVDDGQIGTSTISFQMANNAGLVQLDLRGWASAVTSVNQTLGGVSADGVSDLGHTVAWGGITEVRDASGALVTQFTALSASSGFDYRDAYVSAVPEPPQAAMLIAGLGLLGWRGLRLRRRAREGR